MSIMTAHQDDPKVRAATPADDGCPPDSPPGRRIFVRDQMPSDDAAVRQMSAVAGVTEAEGLCLKAFSDPYAHLRASVLGGTGSGKSALLDALAQIYHFHGVGVTRDLAEAEHSTARVVLVDDIHALDHARYAELRRVLASDKSVVLVSRGHAETGQLVRAADDLIDGIPAVMLSRLNPIDIARRAKIRLNLEVSAELVEVIAETTWGILTLVDAVLNRLQQLHHDEVPGISVATVRSWVADGLDAQLAQLGEAAVDLLTYTAIGAVLDVATLGELLDISGREVDDLLVRAYTTGFLRPTLTEPWGTLLSLVQDVLLERITNDELESMQDNLLAVELRNGYLRSHTARRLADLKFLDRRLVDYVVHTQESADSRQRELDRSDAMSGPLTRADSALRDGDVGSALVVTDAILERAMGPDDPDIAQAVRLAAVAHASSGNLARSADLYTYLGPDGIGSAAADAVVAAVGIGDRAAAQSYAGVARAGAPSSTSVGLELMSRGVLESLSGDGSLALRTLMRAASILLPVGADLVTVDTPAGLAGLAAISRGELDVAQAVLLRGQVARHENKLVSVRYELLLAWTAMLRGDLAEASRRVTTVENRRFTSSAGQLHGRDRLFLQGLRLGIARRNSEYARMASIWQRVRGELGMHAIDVFTLLPLGELYVAASRIGDAHVLSRHMDGAMQLLDALGHPPLWSAPFHWYVFQGAVLAEQVDELVECGERLVAVGAESEYGQMLAGAGAVWLRLLGGDVDVEQTLQAARRLHESGMPWDASRLAAQAAARTTRRADMRELLNYARDVNRGIVAGKEFVTADDVADPDAEQAPGSLVLARLTHREREVAALVVRGSSYREIGAKLFISPKTVEHHVARIRRRIGAQSRSEMLEILQPLSTFVV